MKVLHVLDMSAPAVAGYTARARSILLGQVKAGVTPVALTGLRQGKSAQRREVLDGITHYRTEAFTYGDHSRIPAVGEALEMAALGRRIVDVTREERVDIVHAHSPILCGLPAAAAAQWLKL